jgi:hypothetical protein
VDTSTGRDEVEDIIVLSLVAAQPVTSRHKESGISATTGYELDNRGIGVFLLSTLFGTVLRPTSHPI